MPTGRRFTAAVIGGSGYGGGEIIRRLIRHPEVELVRVASIDFVGEPLSVVHPNLEGQTPLRFEDLDPVEAARGVDIVFLGLPHEVSAEVVPRILLSTESKVVDLSGAFRSKDSSTYTEWYGRDHPAPQHLTDFVYGLPELNRALIRSTRCVANPGCFATCIELGLLPLARRGWLTGSVHTVGITGSSGSGSTPSLGTHHPVRAVNLKTYKPLCHPQTPEIVGVLRAAGASLDEVSFVPVSAPLSRGIFATTFVSLSAEVTELQVEESFKESYSAEPFVRVPKSRLPEVAAVSGSNYAEVGVAMGAVRGTHQTLTCFAALDNLVKGGAGQAVQNMNLMLGLDEMMSLDDPGSWP